MSIKEIEKIYQNISFPLLQWNLFGSLEKVSQKLNRKDNCNTNWLIETDWPWYKYVYINLLQFSVTFDSYFFKDCMLIKDLLLSIYKQISYS